MLIWDTGTYYYLIQAFVIGNSFPHNISYFTPFADFGAPSMFRLLLCPQCLLQAVKMLFFAVLSQIALLFSLLLLINIQSVSKFSPHRKKYVLSKFQLAKQILQIAKHNVCVYITNCSNIIASCDCSTCSTFGIH